jgi:hypothetical protein
MIAARAGHHLKVNQQSWVPRLWKPASPLPKCRGQWPGALQRTPGWRSWVTSRRDRLKSPASWRAQWIASPNPDGRSYADVITRWANRLDLSHRWRNMWIVDFGLDMPESEAASSRLHSSKYARVWPVRQGSNATCCRERWWIHHNRRPEMTAALRRVRRYIATVRHSKYRLFVWLDSGVLLDSACIAIARDDDYTFEIQSSPAEWRKFGPNSEIDSSGREPSS